MTGASVPAELARLAHVLGRPPSELDFLAAVPADQLRVLRRQVARALFDADRAAFEKVAALARRIPVAVAARVAELALPPLVAARAAELLEPGRAAELAARLTDSYLADVAAALDADRAAPVVATLPADRVETVAGELGRRTEWVAIAVLMTQVSPDALRAAARAYDGEQLLRIASLLDSRLDQLIAVLSDAQLDALLSAAAARGLEAELDQVVTVLGPDATARCAGRLAAAAPELPAALDRAVGAGLLSVAARARLTTA